MCSVHTHITTTSVALPYVREQWPQVVVCGAEHGKQVFQRPGARRLMKKLGDVAEIAYGSGDTDKVKTDGLAITRVIGEGDVIDLGSRSIIVMEARGHTDCSLAFKIEPEHILISSETTGVLFGRGRAHTATLKSHEGVIRTIHKCRAYRPKMVICPHYGVMPGDYIDEYWDLIENIANEEKEFIEGMWKKGSQSGRNAAGDDG
ncbi:MAG: MBL fold metallo-hydrolase [Anaerovoracaceae bacterium]